MKKTLFTAVATASFAILFCGCANVLKENNAGFPAVRPGLLYCDMQVAQEVTPPILPRSYKVLGPVSAQGSTTNVLCIVSTGDASYVTLKRLALPPISGRQGYHQS